VWRQADIVATPVSVIIRRNIQYYNDE
jgi:hypothetical protein